MDIMTILELIKSIGILLIGIGIIIYSVGALLDRRNKK